MATKKQKRLAGEQKQAINRAESIRTGLLAQNKDQQHRDAIFKKRAEAHARKERKEKSLKTADAVKSKSKASDGFKQVGTAAQSAAEAFESMNLLYSHDDVMDEIFGPVDTIDLKRIG